MGVIAVIVQHVQQTISALFNIVHVAPTEASDSRRVRSIQPTPQQEQEKDQVYQFFMKLAGEDGEVDWMELKEILDYAMRMGCSPAYYSSNPQYRITLTEPVNVRVLNLLMQRFRDERGELTLEDFIACAVKLKTMISIFENEHDSKTGTATFTLDRWLQITLYN
ncbi:hypothetical protein QE152_g19847 [Popillia japonica]|uniref:Uncharacterized protein n=1 Tax=Popillia japonica TaxID=7064 RepID=A0AAW1KQ30_POPJA